jgi:hypothetical protein
MLTGLQVLVVHCGLALALMFGATVVGVAVTGPTVSAAQRTVMIVGALDLVIAAVTIARFIAATAAFSSGFGRVLWTIVCIGLVAAATLAMFFVTVLSLNR